MEIERRIDELGLILPETPAPAGNYVPAAQVGDLLYTAGMICLAKGEMTHTGKVGADLSLEEAYQGARVCALNCLAAVKGAAGSLEAVDHFLTVTGFVNAGPDFSQSPQVINGASDLFVRVFGDRGKHARIAVTAACLPLNSAVEVQVSVKLKTNR